MEHKNRYPICGIFVALLFSSFLNAQEFDIVIKDGRLIDTKNAIDKVMDIAIKDGQIASVESTISKNRAKTVINAKGLFVSPGLIAVSYTHLTLPTTPYV